MLLYAANVLLALWQKPLHDQYSEGLGFKSQLVHFSMNLISLSILSISLSLSFPASLTILVVLV